MTDFGTDISCTTSLRTGQFSTGVRLLGEACFRRLSTPRGTLRGGEDEANYGLDLVGLIGSMTTPSAAAALPAQISAELLKDERVQSAEVTVITLTAPNKTTSYQVSIAVQSAAGPFALVLAVSSVSITLLGINTP